MTMPTNVRSHIHFLRSHHTSCRILRHIAPLFHSPPGILQSVPDTRRASSASISNANSFTRSYESLASYHRNNLTAAARSIHSTASSLDSSSTPSTSGTDLPSRDSISLVQGASRGLGFEFVRQLLARGKGNRVIATCRDPPGAQRLQNLKDQSGGRLEVVQLDVTNEESIKEAAGVVEHKFGHLDLVLNCAGVLHIPNEVKPETSMRWLDPEAMLLTYQINSIGPILVLKHMAPLLEKGGREKPPAVIASISARVGSIGDNKLGGWYSYRASKSALNQYMRTAAVELARKKTPVAAILLHPGTVDTDLSKPFQRNVAPGKLFTPDYSIAKMLEIIDGVTMADSGKFFAWDGEEIPW